MGGQHSGRPAMDQTWKSDLEGWLAPFLDVLGHKARARMCPAYVVGLKRGDWRQLRSAAERQLIERADGNWTDGNQPQIGHGKSFPALEAEGEKATAPVR